MLGAQVLFIMLVGCVCVSWGLFVAYLADLRVSTPATLALYAVGLWPMLQVEAYEPALFLLIQSGVIMFAIWRCERRSIGESASRRSRFTLATLLLMTVVAAVVLALIVRSSANSIRVWFSLLSGAIGCGAATVGGVWLAKERWNWWKLLVVPCTLMLLALPASVWGVFLLRFPEWDISNPVFTRFLCLESVFLKSLLRWAVWTSLLSAILSLTWAVVVCWRLAGKFRGASLALSALCLLGPLAIYGKMESNRLPVSRGEENGYPLLREARERLQPWSLILDEPQTATTAELRDVLERHQRASELIRQATLMPIHVDQQSLNARELADHAYSIREYGRVLRAEAELAFREERIEEALEYTLSIYELCHQFERCNFIIVLVAGATESYAVDMLRQLRPVLSAEQARRIVNAISRIESDSPSFQELLAHERDWMEKQLGWRGRLWHVLSSMTKEDGAQDQMIQATVRRRTTVRRLAIAGFSVDEFRLHNDRLPADLSETRVRPEHIVDPYAQTGETLRYDKQAGNEFVLYSVGFDQRDEGGSSSDAFIGLSFQGDVEFNRVFGESY